MRRAVRRALALLLDRAPLALFALAAALTAFGLGMFVERTEAWPYRLVADAITTARTLRSSAVEGEHPVLRFAALVDTPPQRAASERVRFHGADALADRVLFGGEQGHFAELCPETDGCLAVEYAVAGEAVRAVPYRVDDIARSPIAERPYEHVAGFSFREHAYVGGMDRYPNGDLLVTFQFEHSHPYGGGVARIGGDGRPLWYRKDYSHHWPAILADGRALVPTLRVAEEPIALAWEAGDFLAGCEDRSLLVDYVQVLDGGGAVVEEIDVLGALLASPWAPLLSENTAECWDLLHLNYAHEAGADAGGVPGLAPGDLVVSFRNLSAFGVLDGRTRELKRLVRGAFRRQHAVRHLEGSRFVMFDNGNELRRASRLLIVDLATGEETTVFPNAATPERFRADTFSIIAGHVSLSPDRERAIVTFFGPRTAFEVRLADGALLTEFAPLHDVRRFPQFPEERAQKSARYKLRGIYYVGD